MHAFGSARYCAYHPARRDTPPALVTRIRNLHRKNLWNQSSRIDAAVLTFGAPVKTGKE
jgi:hypothetical protein